MRLPAPYDRMLMPVYAPSLVLAISTEALLVLLPLYVIELGHGAPFAAFVVGMRGLGILLFDLPAGVLVGRFGNRPVLIGGPAAVAAGALVCAFGTTTAALSGAAVLLGAGHAAWMLGRQSYITRHCEAAQAGRAIGVMAGLQRGGVFVGPAIGGALAGLAGFGAAMTAAAVAAGVAIALVVAFAHDAPESDAGAQRAPALPTPGLLKDHAYTFATAGIWALTLQLMRASRQLLIPLFGQSLGLDVASIGIVYSASAAIDMCLFYPVGVLMDRRGRKWSAVPSAALFALALSLLPAATGFVSLLAVGLLLGLANGLGTGVVMVVGTDFARASGQPGAFLGLWRLIGDVGFTAAPLAAGALVSAASLAAAAFAAAGVGAAGLAIVLTLVPETRGLAVIAGGIVKSSKKILKNDNKVLSNGAAIKRRRPMSKSLEARLEQVKRYGTGLRRLSKAAFALVALGGLAAILVLIFARGEDMNFVIGGVSYAGDAVPLAARLIGVAVAVIGFGLVLWLLFHLIRLFDLYAHGRIFTPANVRHIRQIGVTVFLFITVWLLDVLAQLALTQSPPPGVDAGGWTIGLGVNPPVADSSTTAGLSIGFGGPFSLAILGTVIVFFSWIMDVGRELREEQDLVV